MFQKILITSPPDCADEHVWRARTGAAIEAQRPDALALRMPAAAPVMLWRRGEWLCKNFPQLPLWVSREAEVASALDAAVLWLPALYMSAGVARTLVRSECRLARTCHSLEDIGIALPRHDFIVLADYRSVDQEYPALDLELIAAGAAACKAGKRPLWVTGGVQPEDATALQAAGADGYLAARSFF